ncbi:YdcF family protein [Actinoallomurus acanthiterrae]
MQASSPLTKAIDTLWGYTLLTFPQARVDIGLGLGCHDIGVAEQAASLFHHDGFTRLVFSGATSPATRPIFPDGEAVHFARRAVERGVPPTRILVEDRATNTAENFTATRALLARHGVPVESAVIITRPYHQRRALLTARHAWPDVGWSTSSSHRDFASYCDFLGDRDKVIDYLVGETARIVTYGERGMLGEVETPPDPVVAAMRDLSAAGYTRRPVI